MWYFNISCRLWRWFFNMKICVQIKNFLEYSNQFYKKNIVHIIHISIIIILCTSFEIIVKLMS
jgi:hypothetical protein